MNGQKHILIVDDEAPVRYALSRILSRENYLISEASSGMQTMQLLRGEIDGTLQPVDIMLLDLHLTDMDSFDLLRDLAHAGLCPPVLIVTGQFDRNLDDLPRGVTSLGILNKPVSMANLTASVREAFALLSNDNTEVEPCTEFQNRRFSRLPTTPSPASTGLHT